MNSKQLTNIGLLVLFFLTFSCQKKVSEIAELPNIILIVADDLGYGDISVAKLADDVNTPNIDRIANEGIRFTQAYDNSPICNQSRTGIITGSYPQRLGSYWYSSEGLHDEKFRTIPELLKQKNYNTGYVGKIHYGKHDSDTLHRSFPLNHGFDYFFGHTSARKHYLNHKKEIENSFQEVKQKFKRKGQSLQQGSLWENKNKIDTLGFLTEIIGEKSRQFIKDSKEKPFFLQIAFNATHNFTHQLPEDYLKEQGLTEFLDWNPAKEEYYEWYKKGRYPNNKDGRAHYLGQVHFMDKEIGKILKELDHLNLNENTLIFFISDNGGSTPIYANNTPLKGSKYLLYEGGIRVQLLVSYPQKYTSGKVNNTMISAMDILPTICEEIGIEIPEYIDGKSLRSLINDDINKVHHQTLFWDTGHEIAVRKGDWKLRKAFTNQHAKDEMVNLETGEFLYNLKADVSEKNNLNKSNSKLQNDLENEYLIWKSYISNIKNN